MANSYVACYRGSQKTFQAVKAEIERRWGQGQAQRYDPLTNCLTFNCWLSLGYMVRKGERSIRSLTYIEKKDELGNVIKTYPKTVHLFYQVQVEKISNF